jgi:hypothetical protein
MVLVLQVSTYLHYRALLPVCQVGTVLFDRQVGQQGAAFVGFERDRFTDKSRLESA